jgi:sortase B
MEINPDIYAWIYIPNTNVDYPVARSTSDGDDSFYLEHNVYRQYQFSGTIYSEIKNQPDFHDRVTVLYGHNMLNGSMFATLHNFADPDFFAENNTIFIQTKDKELTYLVYSAYTYDDRHILNSFFFDNDDVFQKYIDFTLDPYTYSGNVREGVKPTINDKILTLSTCTSGASNTRFLVQGVLVDERDR